MRSLLQSCSPLCDSALFFYINAAFFCRLFILRTAAIRSATL
nr:MAG TPA: hypothetical protein [Caudoviricetes sp.]